MVLSNQEIYTAYIEAANQTLRPQDERIALGFAQAIIAATISKLAVGVSVEPVAFAMLRPDGLVLDVICPDEHESHEGSYTLPLYTADAIAAARTQALEEAAIAADLFCNGGESQRPLKYPVATAIRALIGNEEVGFNGLTKKETDNSMSVRGLSKKDPPYVRKNFNDWRNP